MPLNLKNLHSSQLKIITDHKLTTLNDIVRAPFLHVTQKAALIEETAPHSKEDLETLGERGLTPLGESYRRINYFTFDALVKQGANVYADDGYGMPLLHRICDNGFADAYIDILAKHKVDVNGKDTLGNTAFMYATKIGDSKAMRALALAGADTTLANNKGETAQTIADRARRPHICQTLKAIKQGNGVAQLETSIAALKAQVAQLSTQNPHQARQLRTQQRMKAFTHR